MLSSDSAFRESKIFIFHLMRKLSTYRQKFERGGTIKNLQDSYAFLLVRITPTAPILTHSVLSTLVDL